MRFSHAGDVSPAKVVATVCLQKDGFAEIFSRMVETDGIILGSPVYSADVSAKMKAFLSVQVSLSQPITGFFAIKLGLRLQLFVVAAE